MSTATVQLDAGGLLLAKSKVDPGAAEQIVARSYRHPALGERAVIRLASDRLGQAEDLAMEFLGFEAPEVSAPIALQQRRSLGNDRARTVCVYFDGGGSGARNVLSDGHAQIWASPGIYFATVGVTLISSAFSAANSSFASASI